MNILYGIQTTGNGHIVRSRAMIQELRQLGHEVHALLSGCPAKKVMDGGDFPSAEQRQGLTFVVEDGRLNYWKTALNLNFVQFFKDISGFDARGYDLVITDYEPLTARIARQHRLPSIGMGHLYAFTHQVPVTRCKPMAAWIMKNYAPVRYPLGLHWHHFDQPILPPTIPQIVRASLPVRKKRPFYLVYLPFENLDRIVALLTRLRTLSFRLYANVEQPAIRNNVAILPYSRQGFVDDLAGCSGAICNGGFSFISEALYLGKRVLAKPVRGQIEQESNGLALEQLRLGTVARRLDENAIETWLDSPRNPPLLFADVIPLLARWIDSRAYGDYREVVKAAWEMSDVSPTEFRLMLN